MDWLWPAKEIPAVESLDLRKPRVKRSAWDWPEFPAKVAYFIATGKQMPTWRTISVKIISDTTALMRGLNSVYAITTNPKWLAAFNALPALRYRPMRKWHWHRIFFVLNSIAANSLAAVIVTRWVWHKWL